MSFSIAQGSWKNWYLSKYLTLGGCETQKELDQVAPGTGKRQCKDLGVGPSLQQEGHSSKDGASREKSNKRQDGNVGRDHSLVALWQMTRALAFILSEVAVVGEAQGWFSQ